MTHHRQMRAASRDQTETNDALKEFETFFDRFPNSPLMPEVRERWREARDRLSESSI
jgi:outer membrane protein assembly factor BamD (BamD/ComL family)